MQQILVHSALGSVVICRQRPFACVRAIRNKVSQVVMLRRATAARVSLCRNVGPVNRIAASQRGHLSHKCSRRPCDRLPLTVCRPGRSQCQCRLSMCRQPCHLRAANPGGNRRLDNRCRRISKVCRPRLPPALPSLPAWAAGRGMAVSDRTSSTLHRRPRRSSDADHVRESKVPGLGRRGYEPSDTGLTSGDCESRPEGER